MQQPWCDARGETSFLSGFGFARGFCHSTKSQKRQNNRMVLRISQKKSRSDSCSSGEKLLHAITADIGIIQFTDDSHEFSACSFTARLERFWWISHNFDSATCSYVKWESIGAHRSHTHQRLPSPNPQSEWKTWWDVQAFRHEWRFAGLFLHWWHCSSAALHIFPFISNVIET